MLFNDSLEAEKIITSICHTNKVSGFTHDFYKYPARFPPSFARQIIKTFSAENDLVVDPFMGGGTTLVEANILGRRAIGTDISPLATFISKVKTNIYTKEDLEIIEGWLLKVQPKLNLHRKVDRHWKWIDEGYQRNINSSDTWPIRKLIELFISELKELSIKKHRDFARCLLLRTTQWAIDNRLIIPTANEIRNQMLSFFYEFSVGAKEFNEAVYEYDDFFNINDNRRVECLNVSSKDFSQYLDESPKLILTSPPYPGVHVLYHRWQVHGRKETPAPFWIANCKDGHGESFYTMGGRSEYGISRYFESLSDSMKSIFEICNNDSVLVQVVAFSDINDQFNHYLEILDRIGYIEKFIPSLSNSPDGRIWRVVPNRKWYTKDNTTSSQEVVLFHKIS